MHIFEGTMRRVALAVSLLAIGCGSHASAGQTTAKSPQEPVHVAQKSASPAPPLVAAPEPAPAPAASAERAEPEAAATPVVAARPSAAKGKRGRPTRAVPADAMDAASVADAEAMIKLARSEVESSLR